MTPGDEQVDQLLAETGAELAERVTRAVPAWVVRCVAEVFDVWVQAAPVADDTERRAGVMADADAAARRAGDEVAAGLRQLLTADVDAQRTTPLELVRRAVSFPTSVLAAAGVPPVERDRFAEARFPDDDYGLTPASLAALDPSLAELAMRWGAAKAAAHKRRHT